MAARSSCLLETAIPVRPAEARANSREHDERVAHFLRRRHVLLDIVEPPDTSCPDDGVISMILSSLANSLWLLIVLDGTAVGDLSLSSR
jgi:hypothetical protein